MALLNRPALYTARFPLMGGTAVVRFVDPHGQAHAEETAGLAAAEARRIEAKFSRYRPQSVLSEINREAARGPVPIDAETEALVRQALDLSRLSGGRFDPTIGALRPLWDFAAGRVPRADELAARLPLVDAAAIELRAGTVRFRRPGLELDLGGVGKEHAADVVARLLRRRGARSALVNFAGDVRTLGLRGDGRPWTVGVQDPRIRDRCRFALRVLGSAGIATSGDYERCFVQDGIRYHHLLDARTGLPARGLASATVVARSAARAGCLATAAFLLGPEAGLALLARAREAEGALITEDGRVLATEGMARISDLAQRERLDAAG